MNISNKMFTYVLLFAVSFWNLQLVAATGDIWLEPVSKTVAENESFTLEVHMDSGSNKLGAYGLEIGFDNSKLQAETAIAGADGFLTAQNADNANGIIKVNGFDISGKGPGTNLHILTVSFTAKTGVENTPITLNVNPLIDTSGDDISPIHTQGTSLTIIGSIPAPTIAAALESPQQDSFESGIGLIRGWVCEANKIEIQIDNFAKREVAYGTTRGDTQAQCGDSNNGFGFTFNWNILGNGTHSLKAFADNVKFVEVAFNVTTLGVEFLRGVSAEQQIANFPEIGKNTTLRWAEPHQNFVIVDTYTRNKPVNNSINKPIISKAGISAILESPQQGSFESGIGLIRGWICEAETVEIQIDNSSRQMVAYGTPRGDTKTVCGDTNNGFGFTFNWNLLEDGFHVLRAYVDDRKFADVTFSVTSLGLGDFPLGLDGTFRLSNFPQTGSSTRVRWAETHQNFVIVP